MMAKLSFVFLLQTLLAPAFAGPGGCVMLHCAGQLAACGFDSVCRRWNRCIMGCGTDLSCQIRCADLYKPTDDTADKINKFSECVISEHHCVPQTKSTCPKPDTDLTQSLDIGVLSGLWYITRGKNPMFDCFDCQVHNFTLAPEGPKPLHGDLKYAVKTDLNCTAPHCSYLQREVFQNFAQDPEAPRHMINHNNTLAELHYADDWYVLDAKEDTYVLVYYCGCNDASCGYSGAVLYTRSASFEDLSQADVEHIRQAISDAKIPSFSLDGMCSPVAGACNAESEKQGSLSSLVV